MHKYKTWHSKYTSPNSEYVFSLELVCTPGALPGRRLQGEQSKEQNGTFWLFRSGQSLDRNLLQLATRNCWPAYIGSIFSRDGRVEIGLDSLGLWNLVESFDLLMQYILVSESATQSKTQLNFWIYEIGDDYASKVHLKHINSGEILASYDIPRFWFPSPAAWGKVRLDHKQFSALY